MNCKTNDRKAHAASMHCRNSGRQLYPQHYLAANLHDRLLIDFAIRFTTLLKIEGANHAFKAGKQNVLQLLTGKIKEWIEKMMKKI